MEYETITNENVIARLEAELEDLRGKIARLKAFNDKHYNGLEFIGDIDCDNYEAQHMAFEAQLSHMMGYMLDLECRLEILRDIRSRGEQK